ncbi:MAG: AAA family ATPase [Oscillospiraceae bacterium]|jgi:hypothetical protein|nr:AAA family ATPase [Oscillospiraceae bacterium]
MIIWINGAFGAGKTTAAFELQRRIHGSFVFDPENIGYYFRKHLPLSEGAKSGDFQDIPLWRSMNYDMLRYAAREFDGVIIAPMTVVNPQYFDEIIGKLRGDGVDVRHFILCASRETLLKRLSRRLERGDTWAKRQIDRCVTAFGTVIDGEKLNTDTMTVDEIVSAIGARCAVELTPDRRGKLRKWLDRMFVLARHIR